MTFTIVPFVKGDYTDILIDIMGAPKAPYEPNTVTSVFMTVLAKGAETGVFTEEQADYLIQRVAVETGIIQKMLNVGRAVGAAGGDNANEQLNELLVRGLRRVNALNDGGVENMLRDDAEAAGHGFIVLNVDENTTKEEFDAAFVQAGLSVGNGEGNSGEVKLLTDQSDDKAPF